MYILHVLLLFLSLTVYNPLEFEESISVPRPSGEGRSLEFIRMKSNVLSFSYE